MGVRAFEDRSRASLALGLMMVFGAVASVSAQRLTFTVPEPLTTAGMPPPAAAAGEHWRRFHRTSEFTDRQDGRLALDAYQALLKGWAESPGTDEVELLAELEFRLLRADPCLLYEQQKTLTYLARNEPGAVFSALFLQVSGLQHHLEHRRYFLMDSGLKRLREWMQIHWKARKDASMVPENEAALLTYWAELLWQSPDSSLLSRAEGALDDAVDLAPNYVPARYLRAMVTEKLGKYRKALKDLEHLSRRLPQRSDVKLRLAIQLSRRGQGERAAELFRGLTDSGAEVEPWVRAVAFQEWARLEVAQDHPDQAREILRRAREDDPANARFAFMEIEIARRVAEEPRMESQEILDEWSADFGLTPRLRYLFGPLEELTANRDRLALAARESAPLLVEALQQPEIEKISPSLRCSAAWRLMVPEPAPPPQASLLLHAEEEVETKARSSARASEKGVAATTSPSRASRATPAMLHEAEPTQPSFAGDLYVDPETGESIVVHDVTDLELHPIYVTPTRFGRRILDLRKDEITVLDDGRPQEIVTLGGKVPFTATLLLDASASMNGSGLQLALDGVRAFYEAMEPFDQARLVTAADRLRGVSPFLSADDATEAVLDQWSTSGAMGGTALFDHLFLTLDALEDELGRKVVVVLSDGYDLMSAVPAKALRQAVRRSGAQVYWVRLREGAGAENETIVPPTNWRTISETLLEIHHLKRAVAASGGRIVDVREPSEVAGAFTEIVDELREQLVVGYYPDPVYEDGRRREIKVKTSRPGVRMRHSAGYFDEP